MRFEAEKRLLEEVLAPWIVGGVHHIGSTAVPGLAAKPIVDVMVGVEGLEQSLPARPAAEAVGYVWAPYRPDVFHWFCKPSPEQRTHHLILVPVDHRRPSRPGSPSATRSATTRRSPRSTRR